MTSSRKSPKLGDAISARFAVLERWAKELQDDLYARRKAAAETADVVIDLTKRVQQLELFMRAQIDNKWADRLGEHERDIKQLHTELQNVESLAKRLR